MQKDIFLQGIIVGNLVVLEDDRKPVLTPQPEPTSPRIKELLSRALIKPETLKPHEVQELAASVVYHLITTKKP